MSSQKYVNTVLYKPSGPAFTSGGDFPSGSTASLAAQSPVEDVRFSHGSSGAIFVPTTTTGPLPPVGDHDLYRPVDIRGIDRQEANRIEQEEKRRLERQQDDKLSWSWTITAWNVVAFVLCPVCLYCMLGALLCNVYAYADHKSRDYERERHKLRCALWWSIICFAAGIIAVVVILVVLFVVYDAKDWDSIPTVPGSDFTM